LSKNAKDNQPARLVAATPNRAENQAKLKKNTSIFILENFDYITKPDL
jgi:hypothetical protein